MATADQAHTATLQAQLPRHWSLEDLRVHLGCIPLERIRLFPSPGYATEEDVAAIQDREDRLFELEHGILVEKAMGWYESLLASIIITRINVYLETHDLGKVLGEAGPLKILPGVVKMPDVSFIGWDRWPRTELPRRPIPDLVPDLAIEVLSETNTPAEMNEKLKLYFKAGVRLVWYIDPATHSARSFASPSEITTVESTGKLAGGTVLPGFELSLKSLFETADRQGPK